MTTLYKENGLTNQSTISLIISLSIITTSFYTVAANAAPIYKVVDQSTGQVTFTDSPQPYEQQAGKTISQTSVSTGTSSASQTNAASSSQSSNSQAPNTQSTTPLNTSETTPPPMSVTAKRAAINYKLIMIEPVEERAYQRPGQIITVNLQMSPALQVGDSISIFIDDKLISQGITASIATNDLNPGEHKIQAVIQNNLGQVVNRITRTVYVIQNTAILQKKRQLAAQMQAYQALPWQQKLLLKLRQRDNPTNSKK